MAHLTPNYRERRVMVDPEPVPVKVPVKQQVPAKTGPSQDSMWPRRGRVTSSFTSKQEMCKSVLCVNVTN